MKIPLPRFIPEHLHGIVETILFIIIIAAVLFGGYKFVMVAQAVDDIGEELTIVKEGLEQRIGNLEAELATARGENSSLAEALREEQERNEEFREEVEDISDTVGDLEKLSKTDKELLQKYSKVYFLNEHFVPERLSSISKKYTADPNKTLQIHAEVRPFLDDLLEEAENDDIDLRVLSAYRSFGTQAALKTGYTVTYGSGANQFSADQGYSEHQLGTTVDFTSPENNLLLDGFERTEAYQWLLNNAHEYGFVLSYPPGNAYYQFEPWHWRFVGEALARKLKKEGVSFYDWDQRDIDNYLIRIFN